MEGAEEVSTLGVPYQTTMDFITREQARRNIVDLGVPQIIVDAFDEKPLPYNLDIQFRFPYPILSLGPEGQASYGKGRITPVWTGGGDYTVVAYHHDPEREGYFRFSIEDGREEQPVGMNWQQILVEEFQHLWEAEISNDRLRELANWLKFQHLDVLIDELSHTHLDAYQKSVAWHRSFVERIVA